MWMLGRLVGLVVLGLLAAWAIPASPQPLLAEVVQGSDGSLWVRQGSVAWMLVPDQIADSDLSALKLAGEIDGFIPPTIQDPAGATLLDATVGNDGTLYLVQGTTGWLLVPDPIADADLAALSVAGEIDGVIPLGVTNPPSSPPPGDSTPPAEPTWTPTPTPTPGPQDVSIVQPPPAPTDTPTPMPTNTPTSRPTRAPSPTDTPTPRPQLGSVTGPLVCEPGAAQSVVVTVYINPVSGATAGLTQTTTCGRQTYSVPNLEYGDYVLRALSQFGFSDQVPVSVDRTSQTVPIALQAGVTPTPTLTKPAPTRTPKPTG